MTHSSPLHQLREKLGLSQVELAKVLGLTQPQVSKHERGRTPLAKFKGTQIGKIREFCRQKGVPFPESSFLGEHWDDLFANGPRASQDYMEDRKQPRVDEREPL